jgi:hypothetical protein
MKGPSTVIAEPPPTQEEIFDKLYICLRSNSADMKKVRFLSFPLII